MVMTVRPNANETPSRPMPTPGKAAAKAAEPHPANASQNVPNSSAMQRLPKDIRPPGPNLAAPKHKHRSANGNSPGSGEPYRDGSGPSPAKRRPRAARREEGV